MKNNTDDSTPATPIPNTKLEGNEILNDEMDHLYKKEEMTKETRDDMNEEEMEDENEEILMKEVEREMMEEENEDILLKEVEEEMKMEEELKNEIKDEMEVEMEDEMKKEVEDEKMIHEMDPLNKKKVDVNEPNFEMQESNELSSDDTHRFTRRSKSAFTVDDTVVDVTTLTTLSPISDKSGEKEDVIQLEANEEPLSERRDSDATDITVIQASAELKLEDLNDMSKEPIQGNDEAPVVENVNNLMDDKDMVEVDLNEDTNEQKKEDPKKVVKPNVVSQGHSFKLALCLFVLVVSYVYFILLHIQLENPYISFAAALVYLSGLYPKLGILTLRILSKFSRNISSLKLKRWAKKKKDEEDIENQRPKPQGPKTLFILIPVYKENKEQLMRTVNSIADMDNRYKLKIEAFFVIDGTNDAETMQSLKDLRELLEIKTDPVRFVIKNIDDEDFVEIWNHSIEKDGKIYNIFEKKINAGKRHSQLAFFYYLYNYRQHTCDYDNSAVLMVDSDTRFKHNAVDILYQELKKKDDVAGVCGDIEVDEPGFDLYRNAQYFEYKQSHYYGKSIESHYGLVFCVPGAFCLFKMETLLNVKSLREYSQEADHLFKKLLVEMGEDRFFTTLNLMQGKKLRCTLKAKAYTKTPESVARFIDQRRRWSNSTNANILHLVRNFPKLVEQEHNIALFLLMIGTIIDFLSFFIAPTSIFWIVSKFFQDIMNWIGLRDYSSYVLGLMMFWYITILLISTAFDGSSRFVTSFFYLNYLICCFFGICVVVSGIITPFLWIYGIIRLSDSSGYLMIFCSFFYIVLTVIIMCIVFINEKKLRIFFGAMAYFICLPLYLIVIPLFSIINLNNVKWGGNRM